MSAVTSNVMLFGIKNCDSVRKAQKWLRDHDIDFTFHDFRVDGLSKALLSAWLKTLDAKVLINTRSTTWKSLDEQAREAALSGKPSQVILDNPTLIKRPVLHAGQHLEVGFNTTTYASLFVG